MNGCGRCGGRLSRPFLGRRTKLWISSCQDCGHTAHQQTPPSEIALAEDDPIRPLPLDRDLHRLIGAFKAKFTRGRF